MAEARGDPGEPSQSKVARQAAVTRQAALKVRPARVPFLDTPHGRMAGAGILGAAAIFMLLAGIYDLRLERRVDRRLETGPFSGTIGVFAAPRTSSAGDALTAEDLTA